jgi:hypothetical protein
VMAIALISAPRLEAIRSERNFKLQGRMSVLHKVNKIIVQTTTISDVSTYTSS